MKNKNKGRLPPFIPVIKDTWNCAAWKAMSHGARILYIALKGRYNLQSHNNGRLYLSQRKAITEIRSSSNQITRWFRELQHYGFIVMTSPGGLGVYGKGKAPHWRLTEIGYMKDPPTRDFERWNGVRFSKVQAGGETESRSGNPLHTAAEIRSTSAAEIRSTSWNKCSGNPLHTAGLPAAEIRSKSILTTGVVRGRGELDQLRETERLILELPLMTVVEGGKDTPPIEEIPSQVCSHCGKNGPTYRYKHGRGGVWLHKRCRYYFLQARGAVS